jgi:hypothetical protein
MDASRVLGTLRAHCDRLELELRELDADIEDAKAMVSVALFSGRGEAFEYVCESERLNGSQIKRAVVSREHRKFLRYAQKDWC